MIIHFFLTPDSSSVRRFKRLVTEQTARVGVVVGTWPELLDSAAETYLVSVPEGTWEEKVGSAIRSMEGMFWSRSLEVAESETVRAVTASLRMLLEGTTPGKGLPEVNPKSLSDRALRHYNDLRQLHDETENALPDDLTVIRDVLGRPGDEALRLIRVYAHEGLPRLNPWQSALIEKLNSDCVELSDTSSDPALEKVLQEIAPESDLGKITRGACSATNAIARNLFDTDSTPVPLDQSVQWIGVRDHLEEAEVACGMVQEALKSDQSLSWKDFSLLIPADRAYAWAVREIFRSAGLPLSGLPEETRVRDLGRETVLYFLLCRKKPAPNMALAALVTSPLMPWSGAEGYGIAQSIMDGRYAFDFGEQADKVWKRVWKLIRDSEEKPAKLKSAIIEFASLLNTAEELIDHVARARAAAEAVGSMLKSQEDIPWEQLLEAVSPEALSESGKVETTQEGVAVFTEHQEPWRKAKRLLVLGFNEGRYPAAPHRSPVFFDEDIAALKSGGALDVQTQADILQERRLLFKRQLSSAEEITFFVPGRDGLGGSLTPSQSLPFMARLFEGVKEPKKLILDLERIVTREKASGIALAPEGVPVPPRGRDVSDLDLGQDLVMLRKDEEGNPKPQSPSRLGTLMTSPFAWLLASAGITVRDWGPEELSVMEKGTLAHDVFENLFIPNKTLPEENRINESVNRLLNEAIIRICPYMLVPEWTTERKHLEGEIITAALAWWRILKTAGAQIVDVEPWIQGSFEGLPIHGKADAILSLGSKMLVVDYKKSGSGSRRKQMRKGFDSQATLYRTMLQSGGQDGKLAEELSKKPEIGILYYLLNDQTVLTDTSGWLGSQAARVEEMGQNVSTNAIDLIRQKLAEVRKGLVRLNSTEDENWFQKNADIKIYALDDSPLIRLFMREEDK